MKSQNRTLVLAGFLVAAMIARANADTDITQFGAIADGKTLATAAIQKAIDSASSSGGGTVTIPAGKFLTGTLALKDNVTLHLSKGATLLGSTNLQDYRLLDSFTEGTGKKSGLFLLGAIDAKNVALEGEGTIDGQGSQLQNQQLAGTKYRPFLVRWVRCDHVSVKSVHLTAAAMWCMHISQSKNVTVDSVSIFNKGNGNNDGIDIDSSDTIHITNCDIESGDDSMCLKATNTTPDENIQIDNCKLKSDCAAVKFGTESVGDFTNISISHCQIRDTRLGGIKILSVDGSRISNITLSDLTMDTINVPIFLRLGSRLKTYHPGDKPRDTGSISNVTIKNITAKNAKQIGLLFMGVPGHPVGPNINLENITIQMSAATPTAEPVPTLPEKEATYPEISMFGKSLPATALLARHTTGISIKNLQLTPPAVTDPRPLTLLEDAPNTAITNSNIATTQPK